MACVRMREENMERSSQLYLVIIVQGDIVYIDIKLKVRGHENGLLLCLSGYVNKKPLKNANNTL
jgi:hypothetical protein